MTERTEEQKAKARESSRKYMKTLKIVNPIEYRAQHKFKNLLFKFRKDPDGLALELQYMLKVVKKVRKHFEVRGITIEP